VGPRTSLDDVKKRTFFTLRETVRVFSMMMMMMMMMMITTTTKPALSLFACLHSNLKANCKVSARKDVRVFKRTYAHKDKK
jgi:hypothetical protein